MKVRIRGQSAPPTLETLVRARAPLRLGFCGGGTDLMPYVKERGGLVLNATIARHAWATLRPLPESTIRVRSSELDVSADFDLDGPLWLDDQLNLITACVRRLRLVPGATRQGLALDLETEAPAGSGLGASSALVVAIIAAFARWQDLDLGPYEIADLAYRVERKDAGVPGGMQDQYAAAFGGFNLITCHDEHDITVDPLAIPPETVRDLERSSLLVFAGTRHGGPVIESQVAGYRAGNKTVRDALDHMKALALEARTALLRGRLEELAAILHEEWLHKRCTSHSISTPHIDQLYEQARHAGALGGKVSGAGGGGFLYLLCAANRWASVAARLESLGAQVSSVEFTSAGLESWVEGPGVTV